jgi:hypothetical protein
MRASCLFLSGLLLAALPLATAGPYLPDPDELGRLVTIEEQAWALLIRNDAQQARTTAVGILIVEAAA